MANTVSFFAPSGVPETISCRSGNSYSASGNLITGVAPNDVYDLEAAGCVELCQFGAGSQAIYDEGNIYRLALSSAGAISPTATNTDCVVAVFALPANSFDQTGRGLQITAQGMFAANAHTKDVKINFAPSTAVLGSAVGANGNVIADTASSTTSGVGFLLQTTVFKTGANGSNTQWAQEQATIIGSTHGGMGVSLYPTATENAVIYVAVTANAGTASTDITLNYVEVTAMN